MEWFEIGADWLSARAEWLKFSQLAKHAEEIGTVFRLNAEGQGCRRIVRSLATDGIFTTKSSVHRLIRGLPPYDGA